jgi:hypothetical protein
MGSIRKLHQSVSGGIRFDFAKEFRRTAPVAGRIPNRAATPKKEETDMNALPAILSILAAAAAVTLAITAFANA